MSISGGLPDLSSRITLDTSALNAAVSRVDGVVDKIDARLGGLSTAGDAPSKGIRDSFLGNLGASAFTSAIDGVVGFVGGSVDAFAQLEDSTAAAGVLFGGVAGQVESFAARADQAYGLSESAAINAASQFGTLGKAAGLSGAPLADFSTGMAGLAGDLASFKGTSTEQALEAVGAALRGESEPIRAYGVLLDDATLRQEAMALGLTKTTNEALTPQQKVLAAQSAILKQTSDAQGDFARTSDSTANTQKRLAAESANVQAELGAKLAPAITALRVALITLIGSISSVVGFVQQNIVIFGALAAVVAVATVVLGGHAIAVRVVAAATRAWAVVQAAMNLVMSANPIGLVVLAIAALVAAIVIAYQRSETFRAIVQAAMNGIRVAITVAMNAGRAVIAAVMAFISGDVGGTMGRIRAIIGAAFTFVATIIRVQLFVARAVVTTVFGFIRGFVTGTLSSIRSIISGVLNVIVGLFTGNFGRARAGAVQALRGLLSFVSTVPRAILGALSGLGRLLFTSGARIIQGLIDGIRSRISGAVSAVSGALSRIRNLLPFSPAKEGPFSGRGWSGYSGRSIMDDLAGGISRQTGAAVASARTAAARVAASLATVHIPAATLGSVAVTAAAVSGRAVAAGASTADAVVRLSPVDLAALAAILADALNLSVNLDGETLARIVGRRVGADAYGMIRSGV